MRHVHCFDSDMGRIGVAVEDDRLTWLVFGDVAPETGDIAKACPLARAAEKQVREYFAGKRTRFDLPLEPRGTGFERTVWNALLEIPHGETRTYKQIAEAIGRPTACRAVGRANGRNPISIVIPCHRVVGSNGTLTGYAGGLDRKERLLRLEGCR